MKDLEEIPQNVKDGLEIIPVSTVDEVLRHALTKPLIPIEWEKLPEINKGAKAGEGLTTH